MKTHLKTSFHTPCVYDDGVVFKKLLLQVPWLYLLKVPHHLVPFKKNLFQPLLSKDSALLGSLTCGCAGHGTEEFEVWMSTGVIDLATPSPGL